MYAFTTLGMPWINHEWLAELPFYAGYRMRGINGLLVVTVLALELIFLGLFSLTYQHCGIAKSAWVTTLASIVLGTVSFGPRTLLFGWLCLVVELLVITRFETNRVNTLSCVGMSRSLWLIPALFVLWVNLHGSWLIGFITYLTYYLCGFLRIKAGSIQSQPWDQHEKRYLCRILALSFLGLFINPYGWQLVAYPLDLAFNQSLNIAHVQEWQALDSHSIRGRLLFAILAFVFLAHLVKRRSWAPYQIAFFFIGVYAGITYTRFLFLTGILAVPLLAKTLPMRPHIGSAKNRVLLNTVLVLGILILGIRLYTKRAASVYDQSAYPEKALPFLRNFRPQGRVLNSFLWGGYLEFYAPNIPVFIDSRVDIFERRGILLDYLDILAQKNTFNILEKNNIRYVLFEQDAPLAYLLRSNGSWKVDYQDSTAILLEKLPTLPAPCEKKHGRGY